MIFVPFRYPIKVLLSGLIVCQVMICFSGAVKSLEYRTAIFSFNLEYTNSVA